MKNKKLACVALAGVMAVSVLGGCGGSKSGGGRTNSDGTKVVTIWSPTDEPAIEEWWAEKINAFNEEHKGAIQLKREAIVRADSYAYEDKINAAVTSNDLPDILYVDGPNISNYAADGIIVPIDALRRRIWMILWNPLKFRVHTTESCMPWERRRAPWRCFTIKT